MSSKRKQDSSGSDSGSGSDDDAGGKRQRHSSPGENSGSDSGRSGSRSSSGSRSRSRSGSGSKSRSRSRSSSKGGKNAPDSGTGSGSASEGGKKSSASSASHTSGSSSGKEKGKKLLKASDRKASNKLQSTLSNDSDSEDEENEAGKSKKKKEKVAEKKELTNTWRDEFDDGLDSDLVGDDDDRDRLESMTEKQREEELFKRAEQREELKKRYEISKKLRLQQKTKSPSQSAASGKSDGSEDSSKSSASEDEDDNKEQYASIPGERRKGYEEKHAKKFSALSDLKAQRAERERKEKIRMEKESKHKKPKTLSGSESGSDLEKMGKSKKMKASDIYSSSSSGGEETRRRSSSSSSSSSSSVSSISSGESDTERHKSKKVVKKAKNIDSREELEQIRLSRYKVDKFVHLPIFKKTVVGCFVRVGIGHNQEKNQPVYRVAEIVDVCETAKVYDVMKSRTNIGLRMKHGKQERVFRAQFISNQPFSETEFQKWRQTCEMEHVELPTIQAVEERKTAIKKALTYRFSSYDVDKILAAKEKFSKHPHNYAMHKARLMKERQQAVDMGNTEQVEELDVKLAEHEERAEELDRKRTSTISTISLINDRNRKNNIMRAEKGITEEIRRKEAEGDIDDPFTRRKTRPVICMPRQQEEAVPTGEMTSERLLELEMAKKNKEEKKKAEEADKELGAPVAKKPTLAVPLPLKDKDIFNAHDFDIDINVSNMGAKDMPSSIALKPVTSTLTSHNGPTKRSLKIEEWKKKRGII